MQNAPKCMTTIELAHGGQDEKTKRTNVSMINPTGLQAVSMVKNRGGEDNRFMNAPIPKRMGT